MLVDLLKATTTTTGTGNLTLTRKGSFPKPSDHPILSTVDGIEVGYSIKTSGGVVVETGIGTLTSAGSILQRTSPYVKWASGTSTLTIAKNTSALNLTESSYDIDFGLNSVNINNKNDCRDAATNRLIHNPGYGNITSSTTSVTAYTVYYIPIEIESLLYAVGLCVRHSGATLPNYVFALHQRKANGNPGPIIYSTASAVVSTGEGVNTFSFVGGNKMIPPGQYFISMCNDATDSVFRATLAQGCIPTSLGSNSASHVGTLVTYLTETITAPLAIPPSHGTLTEVSNGYIPIVAIKSA